MKMQMDMPYVFAVVITGLVVVFLGLVLLIAFISVIGKIFSVIEKKRAEKASAKEAAPTEQKSAPKPAVAAAPASASNDDEIIAVISAAVAMMSEADNTTYRVRSVRAVSSKAASGNAWAAAGMRESTNPF